MRRDFITEDGKIIKVDDVRLRHIESEVTGTLFEYYENYVKENKYVELFDDRKLHDIHGKANTIILENDTITPEVMYDFARHIVNDKQQGKIPNIFREFLGINMSSNKEGQIGYILDYLRENKIKNICIDSLFGDLDQFKMFCELCLNRLDKVNLFINSRRTLLDTLNAHFTDNTDVRFITDSLRVYDVDFNDMIFKKIAFNSFTGNFHYVNTFFYNDFKADPDKLY